MALERYWDYAYSVSRQGNNTYHGPLEKQAAGGIGTQSSGHHYGILSSGWDDNAYHESTTGYDHISMYDASSDASGTYHYGGTGGYKNRLENATKDVIGYDPVIGADATLSRGKQYFTKWISESDYKDQDTTGRTLQTYRSEAVNTQRNEGYERVGGAVEVINFDQYMNDVGYAEAAAAMGIDRYSTLDQVHQAMGYMQGTWQPPAEEVVEEEVQPDLQVLDGTESGQTGPLAGDFDGDGFVDPVLGITEQQQSMYAGPQLPAGDPRANQTLAGVITLDGNTNKTFKATNLVNDPSPFNASQGETPANMGGTQPDFAQMLNDALYGVGGSAENALAGSIVGGMQSDYATNLQNQMNFAESSYATQLSNALYGVNGTAENPTGGYLGRELEMQGNFDTATSQYNLTIGALNTALYGEGGTADNVTGGYAKQVKDSQEAAIKAQEALAVQAAYGDPGKLTGASVTGVQAAGEEEDEQLLRTLGTTGTFGRDGLRISSLNI